MNKIVDDFILVLKSPKAATNEMFANVKTCLSVIRGIIVDDNWEQVQDLVELLRKFAVKIQEEAGDGYSIFMNLVRHSLKIVRVEVERDLIIEHFDEFALEVETSIVDVLEQTQQQLISGKNQQTILLQNSHNVNSEVFFELIAKLHSNKSILLIAIETGLNGDLRVRLSDKFPRLEFVSDASLFAIMPRVHRILVWSDCVLADGTIRAPSGTAVLATIASYFAVPLYALTTTFSFCPGLFREQRADCGLHEFASGRELFFSAQKRSQNSSAFGDYDSDDGDVNNDYYENSLVSVLNPVYDFVPAQAVFIFVTQHGPIPNACVGQTIKELYDEKDYKFIEN